MKADQVEGVRHGSAQCVTVGTECAEAVDDRPADVVRVGEWFAGIHLSSNRQPTGKQNVNRAGELSKALEHGCVLGAARPRGKPL